MYFALSITYICVVLSPLIHNISVMKKLQLLFSIFFFSLSLSAQYHFSFSHYTSDNGLSQNSITTMLKDHKGYLWIGTRDGLNKFDGYSFKTYTSRPGKKLSVLSNRILLLKEDKWGNMWVKTYDEMVYRLNPTTEEVIQIQHPGGGFVNDKIRDIITLPSGQIWLTTSENGCYKIDTDPESYELRVTLYSKVLRNLPSNDVRTVFEDVQKNVWILTEGGLVCLEGGEKLQYYFKNEAFYTFTENEKRILFGSVNSVRIYDKRTHVFSILSLPAKSTVTSLASLTPNNYLLGTSDNGFYAYDFLQNKIQQFSLAKYPQMQTNAIEKIYVDRAGDAWLSIKSAGVLHFTFNQNKIDFIASKVNEGQISNPNFLIFEDEKDMLWVQPYFGSFSWYNRASNALIPFSSVYNEDINTLFGYGVNHVVSDTQGVMWISTNRGNGFFKCTFLPDYFNHYLFQEHPIYSISNEIRSIYEDRDKRMWVATKDGVVHVFDANKREIGTLNSDGSIGTGRRMEVFVYNFFQDRNGVMWLATKRQGLLRLIPSAKNRFKIENYLHNNADPYSPAGNDFYSVTQDRQGRIWAGCYSGGLHLIVERNGKICFIHSKNELKSYPITNCSKVRQVFADSKGFNWVATTEGFVVFDSRFKDVSKIKFDYYHKNNDESNGLSANDVHCILEDSQSTMWFGTFGGGLNKLKTRYYPGRKLEFEIFDRNNGLPNNVVYSIVDDQLGALWLSTENSIIRFGKKNNQIEVFGKGNELENVEFSEASACLLSSGEICVGSKSGFYSFQPQSVRRRVINAPLVFTRLFLFNKEVQIGGDDEVLRSELDKAAHIELSHKQNVFSIEFATLDMRAPEKIQYAYKLDGFDADWTYVQSTHFATYTSLPPGTYIFRVKSTDSEGVWLDNERQMEVKILPSFWQSIYAKIIYFLFVVGLFLGALYFFMTIYKLKNNMVLEQQMSDMKLRFFTDISHELRTPLTLISLPVDNILQEDLDPDIKEQMTLVRRNLDRVMGLINQILDFRKIQNNKMRLSVEELNFGDFVRVCSSNFNEVAHSKNIRFEIINDSYGLKVWADHERLDSIITNLLSNAFKFTPAGKKIIVRTFARQNALVLAVSDEGIGIAQEKINFIFDRFFSISPLKNFTQKSTGIGLDLVKKLVDLHHAEIRVESQLGKGTVFEVEFKPGNAHFEGNADIILSDHAESTLVEAEEIDQTSEFEYKEQEKLLPQILVVEDNEELRHFLKKTLKKHYRVVEADNGKTGWQKVEQIMPDLIIADLLMPEMDGIELTQKVKGDGRTSHIPVILLTAVTDMESKVAAMKTGTDDYITKPFSSEFLLARIENLMAQRKQLQHFYREQIAQPKPDFSLPPLELKSQEEVFMQNLIKLMNENLDNFDLNIDFLATELGMSRTVFFNKLKSLTGFSPVEFVREVRFERAAEYMKNTQLTVSEISYLVGIEDPRYFSRCFKQKFGVTPSEYRSRHEAK